MRRVLGITVGLATHALFVGTVYRLYGFLAGDGPESAGAGLWLNGGLSLAFGASHSLFLHPHVRELPGRHIAPAFYGLVYCVVTCSTLLALMAFWQHSPVIWWELTGISHSSSNFSVKTFGRYFLCRPRPAGFKVPIWHLKERRSSLVSWKAKSAESRAAFATGVVSVRMRFARSTSIWCGSTRRSPGCSRAAGRPSRGRIARS